MASRKNDDRRFSGQRESLYGRGAAGDYSPQDLEFTRRSSIGPGSGYTADSFSKIPDSVEPIKGGRDEEGGGGWDVFADFNNTGPRYSTMGLRTDNGYRPLSRPDTLATKSKKGTSTTYEPEVELVTVPGMGAEWTLDELKDMKKSGKKEKAAEERRVKWNAWKRDQTGLCGIPWLTRRLIVWVSFGLFIFIGLLLFFLIPRVPSFGFNLNSPLSGNGGPAPYFNRYPANFSFTADVDLQADTGGSFVPLHFHNITATIYDSDENVLVAEGSTGKITLKPRSQIALPINVTFAYDALNTSDTTWNKYYLACRNKIAAVNATRPGLNLRLVLEMKIAGLIGSYSAATLISNTECPIQLPVNAG